MFMFIILYSPETTLYHMEEIPLHVESAGKPHEIRLRPRDSRYVQAVYRYLHEYENMQAANFYLGYYDLVKWWSGDTHRK
jgi:hypothetical protein